MCKPHPAGGAQCQLTQQPACSRRARATTPTLAASARCCRLPRGRCSMAGVAPASTCTRPLTAWAVQTRAALWTAGTRRRRAWPSHSQSNSHGEAQRLLLRWPDSTVPAQSSPTTTHIKPGPGTITRRSQWRTGLTARRVQQPHQTQVAAFFMAIMKLRMHGPFLAGLCWGAERLAGALLSVNPTQSCHPFDSGRQASTTCS